MFIKYIIIIISSSSSSSSSSSCCCCCCCCSSRSSIEKNVCKIDFSSLVVSIIGVKNKSCSIFFNLCSPVDCIFVLHSLIGTPGVWGIWGEWQFVFRELGSTDNYFRDFWEQAHSFGDLGSPAKK